MLDLYSTRNGTARITEAAFDFPPKESPFQFQKKIEAQKRKKLAQCEEKGKKIELWVWDFFT
jgi:hypothetical protein